MTTKEQNAITIYLDKDQEMKIITTAKTLGLNKSSFCRTSALEKANQVLKLNSASNTA
jgi:uncharacterized protein (DUF1778 family)